MSRTDVDAKVLTSPVALSHCVGETLPEATCFELVGSFLPGWELVRPLVLTERVDTDGSFLVTDSVFPIHGLGRTSEIARQDYMKSLVDLYHFWKSDVEKEYAGAEEDFAFLKEYVRPTSS